MIKFSFILTVISCIHKLVSFEYILCSYYLLLFFLLFVALCKYTVTECLFVAMSALSLTVCSPMGRFILYRTNVDQ